MANIKVIITMFLIVLGLGGLLSPFWLIGDILQVIGVLIGLLSFGTLGCIIYQEYREYVKAEEEGK